MVSCMNDNFTFGSPYRGRACHPHSNRVEAESGYSHTSSYTRAALVTCSTSGIFTEHPASDSPRDVVHTWATQRAEPAGKYPAARYNASMMTGGASSATPTPLPEPTLGRAPNVQVRTTMTAPIASTAMSIERSYHSTGNDWGRLESSAAMAIFGNSHKYSHSADEEMTSEGHNGR